MTERIDPNDLFEEMPAEKKVNMTWRSHGEAPDLPPRWCVKGVIPETGIGILSGQWGTFKTTIALDVSLSVMTGAPFADRYRVKRQGAVAYVALEGANMMGTRLAALANARGVTDHPLPFFWCDTCPSLTSPNAANEIVAALSQLPLAGRHLSLVWVDTIATAAGYSKSGDDNDAAVTQRVMNTLAAVARDTGAFVMCIDHFGKVVETGTRGSSAKEGAVDTVLAALGARDINGIVAETRLALRKQRDGISGLEMPYTAEVIETGRDEDGDPITAIALSWNEPAQTKAGTPEERWPKSLRLLRRILVSALSAGGQEIQGSENIVRAVRVDVIRLDFYRQHWSEGSEEQRKEARRKAFYRALKEAQSRNLIGCCEIDEVQWVWLVEN
jgi:CheY-like chemotaxis protein